MIFIVKSCTTKDSSTWLNNSKSGFIPNLLESLIILIGVKAVYEIGVCLFST